MTDLWETWGENWWDWWDLEGLVGDLWEIGRVLDWSWWQETAAPANREYCLGFREF